MDTNLPSSYRPLDGHNIVLTGASEGIGLGIAERFVVAGANVMVVARRVGVLERAVGRLERLAAAGQRVLSLEADVSERESIDRLFAQVAEEFSVLNGLVANAGSGEVVPFLETSYEQWQRSVDLNLTGTFLCVQSAARLMTESPERSRSIVVTSSIRGLGVRPGLVAYSAVKAGLNQMVRVAAYELAPSGIRVNALSPGITATPMTLERNTFFDERSETVPMGRAGTPRDMAEAALYLCGPTSGFVTGLNMVVDGGESLF